MKFSRLIVPIVIALVALAIVVTSAPKQSAPATAGSQQTTAASADSPIESPTAMSASDNDLVPRYAPGQKRRYLVFSKTVSESSLLTQDDPLRVTSEIFLIFTIECVAQNAEHTELVLTYERIRSSSLSKELSLRSDTKFDTDSGQENSSVAYLRAIGVPITITLDSSFEIESAEHDVNDFDETVNAFRVSLFLLNINGIRHYLDLLFAHTAEQSDVQPGEPWTRHIQYEGHTSNRWIETEHTLIESSDGIAQLAFTGFIQNSEFDEEFPDPDDAPEFPNLEGTYEWSVRDGSLRSAESNETFARESFVTADLRSYSNGQTNTVIRQIDESFELDQVLEQLTRTDPALGPRPAGAANIDRLVNRAKNQMKVPALGAAIVNSSQLLAFGIIGERNIDTKEPIRTDDRFNLGFVSANVSATAIGTLVSDGVLEWDAPIPSAVFPSLHESYAGITLAQLLGARAGLPGFNTSVAPEYEALAGIRGDATSYRHDAITRILGAEPATEPGSGISTSAASTAAAVVLAEQATGKSWDDIIHEAIIAPLHIRTAQFDWPTTVGTPDQPQGHILYGESLGPIALGGAPAFDPLRRPATGLSLSLEDFARFASHELAALNGSSDMLAKADALRIHDAPDGKVAMNWILMPGPNGITIHWNGSMSGGFTSVVMLVPEYDLGVVVVANSSGALNGLRDFAFELLRQDPRINVRSSRVVPTIEPAIE